MSLETAAEREARLTALKARLNDITLNGDAASVAIAELSTEDDASIAPTLLAAFLRNSHPARRNSARRILPS